MTVTVKNLTTAKVGFADLKTPGTGLVLQIDPAATVTISDLFAPNSIFSSDALKKAFEAGNVEIKKDAVAIGSWSDLAPSVGTVSIDTSVPLNVVDGGPVTPEKVSLTTTFVDILVNSANIIYLHNHSAEEIVVAFETDVTNIERIPPSSFDGTKIVVLSQAKIPVRGMTKLQAKTEAGTGDILVFRE